jgi:tetratricopeptide (TPR) repeat protein
MTRERAPLDAQVARVDEALQEQVGRRQRTDALGQGGELVGARAPARPVNAVEEPRQGRVIGQAPHRAKLSRPRPRRKPKPRAGTGPVPLASPPVPPVPLAPGGAERRVVVGVAAMTNERKTSWRVPALLAMLGACAPPPASPAQGAAWSQLTTPHFTLYTDVPPEDARASLDELEARYGAFEGAAFPYGREPAARVEVMLFRDKSAFDRFTGHPDGAVLFGDGRDPEAGSMLVFHQRLRPGRAARARDDSTVAPDDSPVAPDVRALLQHHLARRFVAFHFPAAPRWLSAGLATFYETLDVGAGRLTLGRPPEFLFEGDGLEGRRFNPGAPGALPGVEALVAGDAGRDDELASRDVAAWHLVHLMRLGPRPFQAAFHDFLAAVHRGEEGPAAWRAALGRHGVTTEQVEAEYRRRLNQPGTGFFAGAYAPPRPARAEVRPLAEAEAHALWARLYHRSESVAQEVAELDAALKADPHYAPAYIMRGRWYDGRQRPFDALADFRRAVALAPTDPRPAYALATYLDGYFGAAPPPRPEFAAELGSLIERLRRTADAPRISAYLAYYDFRQGDHARAVAGLRRAVAADPACTPCYRVAAAVFARGLGCLDEAAAAQRKAVGSLLGDSSDQAAALARLESELAARPAPSTGRPPPGSCVAAALQSTPATTPATPPAGAASPSGMASPPGAAPPAGASGRAPATPSSGASAPAGANGPAGASGAAR